jgi:cellulase/cellobiase CelA1
VNSGSGAINGWTVAWTFPGNQQVTNLWNGVVAQTGANVTVHNAAWNGTIQPGSTVNFGFLANFSGTNINPSALTLNGHACGGSAK